MKTETPAKKLTIKKRVIKSYAEVKLSDDTMLTTNPTSISISSSFF